MRCFPSTFVSLGVRRRQTNCWRDFLPSSVHNHARRILVINDRLPSTSIDTSQLPIVRRTIPNYPQVRPVTLDYLERSQYVDQTEKICLRTVKNRLLDPAENCALEFKGESRRFGICSVSATIDIDRSIFELSCNNELGRLIGKKPSARTHPLGRASASNRTRNGVSALRARVRLTA